MPEGIITAEDLTAERRLKLYKLAYAKSSPHRITFYLCPVMADLVEEMFDVSLPSGRSEGRVTRDTILQFLPELIKRKPKQVHNHAIWWSYKDHKVRLEVLAECIRDLTPSSRYKDKYTSAEPWLGSSRSFKV